MGNKSFITQSQSSNQPQNVKKTISISKDPITGKFLGVPKEWADELNADENYIIETSQLPEEVRTHQIVKKPRNSKSLRQTIQVNQNSPCGFSGLDEKIQNEIFSSGLSRNEILVNSDNFISILEIFDGKELAFKQDIKVENQIEFIIDNPATNYIFTQQIGRGQNCKLYKIIDRETKNYYIAKVIKFYDQFNSFQLKREIAKTISLACPNVVQYQETYLHSGFLFVIMEYMNVGNLNDLIQQFRHQITESMIAYILQQILLFLKLLHYKGLVHGNLNSRKILLNSKGEVKILTINNEQQTKRSEPCWLAPEVIESHTYVESADIWSVGMIAYHLSEGSIPNDKLHPIKIMYNIINNPSPKISSRRTEDFQKFTQQCLIKNYRQRASLKDLLKSDFIQKNKEKGMTDLIELIDQKRKLDGQKSQLKKSQSLK